MLITLLIIASAAGWVIIGYKPLALSQGWSVSKLFGNAIFRVLLGALSFLGQVILFSLLLPPVWGIGVFLLGGIVAVLACFLFKRFVQRIALTVFVLTWFSLFFL